MGGAPKGMGHEQHGLTAASNALSKLSAAQLDEALPGLAPALEEWRQDVLAALGGAAELSPQRTLILDRIIRKALLLAVADRHVVKLLSEGVDSPSGLVRHAKKGGPALVALVEQVDRLDASLLKLLQALGLDRRPKPVPTIAELLAQHGPGADAGQDPADHPAEPVG